MSAAGLATQQVLPSRSIAFVLLGGMLLGTAGTAAAFAPTGATGTSIGGLRLTFGAIALLLLLPLLGGRWSAMPEVLRRPPVWIMGLSSACFQPMFFMAMERNGVAASTLIAVGASPVFTGLLGLIILRHRLTRAWIFATSIAVMGLSLISLPNLEVRDPLALIFAFGAALAGACYVVAAKYELAFNRHVAELPAGAYLIGAIALLPVLVSRPLAWSASLSGVLLVIYLGVVTMAVANVLQARGMKGLPSGPAATLMLADPLTATLLGVLLLGEPFHLALAIGALLVAVSLLLQAQSELRRAV